MPIKITTVFLFVLSTLLLHSCGHLREIPADEEDVAVEELPVPEESEEEITGLPAWYDPMEPVQITEDSLVITAAAVAADSADARSIAGLAILELKNRAVTEIILLYLEEDGQEVMSEVARTDEANRQRDRLIRALIMGEEDVPGLQVHTESVHWHRDNEQVRCYVRQVYNRVAVSQGIREAMGQ